VFIGKDPVTGNPLQITRTYSADRKEPGAGKRAAEKKLAALVAAAEWGEYGGEGEGPRPRLGASWTNGRPTPNGWAAARRPSTSTGGRSTSRSGRTWGPSGSTS
jgi:hypothetical protein